MMPTERPQWTLYSACTTWPARIVPSSRPAIIAWTFVAPSAAADCVVASTHPITSDPTRTQRIILNDPPTWRQTPAERGDSGGSHLDPGQCVRDRRFVFCHCTLPFEECSFFQEHL